MKKNNNMKRITTILAILLLGAGAFIFLSPQFEKNLPQISFQNDGYWNFKDKIAVNLKDDDSGIKYYKVTFKSGASEKVLQSAILDTPLKEINLSIEPPILDMFENRKNVQIVVSVVDNSKWNFLEGNSAIKSFDIVIDDKKPIVNIIANSLSITRGGSAIAIAQVKDENLENAYISFNNEENIFALTPFYKDGYFAALIPWDVKIEKFSQVSLVAKDKAGNITEEKIPLYINPLKMRNDNIKVSENFIKNVSASVLKQSLKQVPNDLIDIFLVANKTLREENVNRIKNQVKKHMNNDIIKSFDIKPFKRLSSSKTVAYFAERRHYYFNDEKIDEAWHLGMDWASVKHAPIKVTNNGKVIANEYIGIYGNTVIVDHGFGLASLYAHTSNSYVNIGEEVSDGQVIANTGATGAVFGDHLHFGVLVQGVEVNPLEWMDKNWIKTRITDTINNAKKIIGNE